MRVSAKFRDYGKMVFTFEVDLHLRSIYNQGNYCNWSGRCSWVSFG